MARKLGDGERAHVAVFVDAVRRGQLNMLEAAAACGTSYATMHRHCRKAGIKSAGPGRPPSLSREEQDQARKLKARGMSERGIARTIGCGRSAVGNAIRRNGK